MTRSARIATKARLHGDTAMPSVAAWAAMNTARKNAAITKNGPILKSRRTAKMNKFRIGVVDMPERSYLRMVLTRTALFVAAMVLTCIK